MTLYVRMVRQWFLEASPTLKGLTILTLALTAWSWVIQIDFEEPAWQVAVASIIFFGLVSVIISGLLWVNSRASEVLPNLHPEASKLIMSSVVKAVLIFAIYSCFSVITRT